MNKKTRTKKKFDPFIYSALFSIKCCTCCTEKYLKYFFPNDRSFQLNFKEYKIAK